MGTLLTVAALTLIISGMCSLFEATLYSTTVPTLEAAQTKGRRRLLARRFLAMKTAIARPTSAILILNTLANTGGATIAGMYAAQVLGMSWVPVFSGGLTLGILLFSEILPKTYGAVHWRRLWPFIVWPLAAMEKLFYPVIRSLEGLTRLLTRGTSVGRTTESEIVSMIRLGARSGALSATELQLLNSVFRFDEMVCRQAMVPRREVAFLRMDDSLDEALALARQTRHSRYPLCMTSLDDATGLIHVKDLLNVPRDQSPDLVSLARSFPAIPETLPLSRLLRRMQAERLHMALVVDEHGTAVGVITLENVLEELVGAVQDEFDSEAPDIVAEGEGRFRVRGQTTLGRLNHELELELEAPHVDTLSGLLVSHLGRLPTNGDVLELEQVTARVLEVKQGLASQVRLQIKPKAPDQ